MSKVAAERKNNFAEDSNRLEFIPLEAATLAPSGLIEHIKDHWWCVHPKKGVIFFKPHPKWPGTPQCNANEEIALGICKRLYHPWAEVRFIPSVFRRIRPEDYL